MVVVELPEAYGNVLLVVVCIVVQCQLTAYLVISPARLKAFGNKYMEQHFGEEHKKYFKSALPRGGLPDTGSGWYSKHLSYKEWFDFNTAQRTFLNYLEQLTTVVVLLLVAGIKHADCTFYIGCAYFVCRLLYALLYKAGPDKRYPAVIGMMILLVSLIYLSVDSALSFGKAKIS